MKPSLNPLDQAGKPKQEAVAAQGGAGASYADIFLLTSILVFSMASFGIITPVLGEIQAWGRLTTTQIGVYFSAFGMARLVMNLPAGYIIDRFGGRLLTVFGLIAVTAGSLMSAMAPHYFILFAARVITGVGSTFTAIAVQTELLLLTDDSRRAGIISYSMIARRAGASIFPFAGGLLAAFFNWRAVFYFCVLLNLIGIYIVLRSPHSKGKTTAKDTLKSDSPSGSEAGACPAPKASVLIMPTIYLLAFTMFINRNGLEKTLIPLYGSSIGIDSILIGFTLSCSGFASMAAIFYGGRLADKYGRKPVVIGGLSILLLANSLFLIVKDFPLFFIANIFFALTAFTMSLPMVIAADITPAAKVGSAVGMIRLFNDGGLVVGPILLSWLMDYYNLSISIGVSIALILLTLLASIFFLRESIPAAGDKRDPCIDEIEW